jgi:hypothetical protein
MAEGLISNVAPKEGSLKRNDDSSTNEGFRIQPNVVKCP